MNERLAEAAYARLPVFLQNAVCAAWGWREARTRLGPEFRRRLDELAASEGWSRARIDAWQDEQVARMVKHAYERVPFYRERMRAAGVSPADVRGRADLARLPVVTKEDVRASSGAMLAENADRRALRARHTSGTTGSSLHFYTTAAAVAFQWAVWWRHRRRHGVEPGMLHANFTGKLVVPLRQTRPPYWRWNPAAGQALLNMQHVTPANIRPIIEFLDAEPFVFWSGYPSIIHAVAATALEAGLSLRNPPRVVDTGAENVLDLQRRDITRLTGARMIDQYGFSEGCGNASSCPHGRYHEDFEFGVLECLNPEPLPGGRVRGEIVATGLACPEFPFIRYRVGDTGVWEPEGFRCPCGRESRVLAWVEGRQDDYVITPEGTRVMRFDYLFKDTHRVRECQVVQERLGEITLRVVRRPGYGAADERTIEGEVRRWISPTLKVRFDYVERLERERSGKFRAVKSLLPRGMGTSGTAGGAAEAEAGASGPGPDQGGGQGPRRG
ncbi:MAG TPA: hypothetical protein VFS20_01125 [Longimicrobium sp.]|nr:hypothetical protein [Longimicrobium sp.]